MVKKFEMENFAEKLPNDSKSEFETLLDDFKIGLIKLGLKGIEDLNNKRVQNPNDFYNSLTALYNAVKN